MQRADTDGTTHAQRYLELDGLRGVAIALVLVWHYVVCQIEVPRGSMFALPMKLLQATWSGVDLFFVLSGFLVATILLQPAPARRLVGTFYLRRACRILPLYLVLLALFFILAPRVGGASAWLFATPMPPWSYATLTQNFSMGAAETFGANFMGATWSLAVEEQFYLLLPLLIVGVPRRFLPAVLLALVASAPVARFAVQGLGAYVYPFCRTDSVLIGALCALAVRHPAWTHRHAQLQRPLATAVQAFLLVFVAFSLMNKFKTGGIASHVILGVGYGAVLLFVLHRMGTPQIAGLRSAPLVWLGRRSYAVYLFHQPISGLIHGAFGDGTPHIVSAATASLTLASVVVVVVLAEVSFHVIEAPFLALGRRFSYSASPAHGTISR